MAGRQLSPAVAALLSFVAASGAGAAEPPRQRIDPLVAACRVGEGRASANPNLPGGWTLVGQDGSAVLCLTGTLEAVAPAEIVAALGDADGPIDLVVRSTGGPVDTWLTLAEGLIGRVDVLVVDEACLSSCANYMLPLARTVLAREGSLVAWHGGPSGSTDAATASGTPDIAAIVAYDEQARRTERLYRRLGIDVAILTLSGVGPDPGKLEAVASALGLPAVPPPVVGGYAFSPARLAHCFGFRNVDAMWHAGDDLAVARLAQRRSRRLLVLESPFDTSAEKAGGAPRCGRR